MPNTAVKPANAESTWGEAPWEDRKPLINEKSTGKFQCFFAVSRQQLAVRSDSDAAARRQTQADDDASGSPQRVAGRLARTSPTISHTGDGNERSSQAAGVLQFDER